MSKISQGLRGAALEEGLRFRLGNLSPMCPLANQSKAQSPQDRRDWARWGSRCQSPVHSLLMWSHAGWNVGLVHIPPRAGIQSRGLSLVPPSKQF